MSTIVKLLNARKEKLEALLPNLEKELRQMPEGRLRVCSKRGNPQFYHVTKQENEEIRKYINSAHIEIAKELSQKQYIESLVKSIKLELAEIQMFLERGIILSSDHVYEKMDRARKSMVRPYLLDDETYAEWWQSQPFEPNPFHPEHLIYHTKRGEMVRSKAEAMIADMYYELNIPYKYDAPLKLGNGKVKYVDFTLLHKASRKVYYHEHLGRLDDSGYRMDALQKLDQYRQSGVFLGKNLILSHETEGSPLNMKMLKKNTIELFYG